MSENNSMNISTLINLRDYKGTNLKVSEAGLADSVKHVQNKTKERALAQVSNDDLEPLEVSNELTYNAEAKTLNTPNVRVYSEDSISTISPTYIETPHVYSANGNIGELIVDTGKILNINTTNATIYYAAVKKEITIGSVCITTNTITAPYVIGTSQNAENARDLQGGSNTGITVPFQKQQGKTEYSEPLVVSGTKIFAAVGSNLKFVPEGDIHVASSTNAVHAVKADKADYSDSVKTFTKVFQDTRYTIPTVRTNAGDGTQIGITGPGGYTASSLTVSTKDQLQLKVEDNNMYLYPGDPNYNVIVSNLVLNIPTDVSFRLSSDPNDLGVSATLNTDVDASDEPSEEPAVYALKKALSNYTVEYIYKVTQDPQNESQMGPEVDSDGETLTYVKNGVEYTSDGEEWNKSHFIPDGWTSSQEITVPSDQAWYQYMTYRVLNDDDKENTFWEPFSEPMLVLSNMLASTKDPSNPALGAPRNVLKFDFTIPRGLQGEKGEKGEQGKQGPIGPSGKDAVSRVERRVFIYKSCPVTEIANKTGDGWKFNPIGAPQVLASCNRIWNLETDQVGVPSGWKLTDKQDGTHPVWMSQSTYTAVTYPGEEPQISYSTWTEPVNIISSAKLITIYGVFRKDATQEIIKDTLQYVNVDEYIFANNTITISYTGSEGSWNVSSDECNPDPKIDAVWISQASFNNYGDQITNWTVPQRITGADGINGRDAEEIEFIYCALTTQPNIDALRNSLINISTSGKLLEPKTQDGFTWTNHPSGVSLSTKYEYGASRNIKVDENNNRQYEQFGTPFLWSNWGETGRDGDGIEYIYKLSVSTNIGTVEKINGEKCYYQHSLGGIYCGTSGNLISPWLDNNNSSDAKQRWNSKTEEFIPTGWTDEPSGVSMSTQYEYVSSRKYNGAEGYYEPFSKPILWAKYGEKGDTGEAGKDGISLEYIYFLSPIQLTPGTNLDNVKNLINSSTNAGYVPLGTTTFVYNNETIKDTDNTDITSRWTDHPSGVSDVMPYEYTLTRKSYYDSGSKKTKWYSYDSNNIILWSAYGETGLDGDGVEYIFTVTTGIDKPEIPNYDINSDDYQKSEYIPTGWLDDVPELGTEVNIGTESSPDKVFSNFIWVASRKYRFQGEGPNARGKKYGWQAFTEPKLWAKLPEPGKDSDTIEFIYTNTNKVDWPNSYATYLNDQITELLVDTKDVNALSGAAWGNLTWTNNPSGVSIDKQYEYVSLRTISSTLKLGSEGYTQEKTFGSFSEPVLYSRYGSDGAITEYRYKLSTSATVPDLRDINNEEIWFNKPQNVTIETPYQFISSKLTIGTSWSTPVLWNYLPKDGEGLYAIDFDNETINIALKRENGDYKVVSGMNIGTSGIKAIGGSDVELEIGTVVLKSNDENVIIGSAVKNSTTNITSNLTTYNLSSIRLSTQEISFTYDTSKTFNNVGTQTFKLFADIKIIEKGQPRVVTSARVITVLFQTPGADGKDGETPVLYELMPSANAVRIGTNGKRKPESILILIKKTIGGLTTVDENIPEGYCIAVRGSKDGEILEPTKYNNKNYYYCADLSEMYITMYHNTQPNDSFIIDTEHIPFISDGKPGTAPSVKSSETLYRISTDGTTPPSIEDNEANKWTMIVDYLIGIPFNQQYVWAWTRTYFEDSDKPIDTFSVTRGGRSEQIKICEAQYLVTGTNYTESEVRQLDSNAWNIKISTVHPGDYIWAKQDTKYYDTIKLSDTRVRLGSIFKSTEALLLATGLIKDYIIKNTTTDLTSLVSEQEMMNNLYPVHDTYSTNLSDNFNYTQKANINKYLGVIIRNVPDTSVLSNEIKEGSNVLLKYGTSSRFGYSNHTLEQFDNLLSERNIEYEYVENPVISYSSNDTVIKRFDKATDVLISLKKYPVPEFVSNTLTSYSVTRVGMDGENGAIHVAYLSTNTYNDSQLRFNNINIFGKLYNCLKISSSKLNFNSYNSTITPLELTSTVWNFLNSNIKTYISTSIGFSITPVQNARYMGVYTNNIAAGENTGDSQNPGDYTWTKISVVELNDSPYLSYVVRGTNSLSKTELDNIPEYNVLNSNDANNLNAWQKSIENAKKVNNGCYLWTRTIRKYSDGTSKTSYDVSRIKSPIVYPAGEWSSIKTYTWSEEKLPYVLHDNEYWVVNKTCTGETPSESSSYWTKMEQFEALYAKLLIAENGTIGEAVFNDDYMFSQYGVKLRITTNKLDNNFTRPVINIGNTSVYKDSMVQNSLIYSDVKNISEAENTKYQAIQNVNISELKEGDESDSTLVFTTNYKNFNKDNPYASGNLFIPNTTLNFKTGETWFAHGNVHIGIDGVTEFNKITMRNNPESIPMIITDKNIINMCNKCTTSSPKIYEIVSDIINVSLSYYSITPGGHGKTKIKEINISTQTGKISTKLNGNFIEHNISIAIKLNNSFKICLDSNYIKLILDSTATVTTYKFNYASLPKVSIFLGNFNPDEKIIIEYPISTLLKQPNWYNLDPDTIIKDHFDKMRYIGSENVVINNNNNKEIKEINIGSYCFMFVEPNENNVTYSTSVPNMLNSKTLPDTATVYNIDSIILHNDLLISLGTSSTISSYNQISNSILKIKNDLFNLSTKVNNVTYETLIPAFLLDTEGAIKKSEKNHVTGVTTPINRVPRPEIDSFNENALGGIVSIRDM